MTRCTAQNTITQHSALAVICSARRHGHRTAAAAMPLIQFVDVTLSETAEAATYHPSRQRRRESTAESASGTRRRTRAERIRFGTIRKNIALDVEHASSVNTIASNRRPATKRAVT